MLEILDADAAWLVVLASVLALLTPVSRALFSGAWRVLSFQRGNTRALVRRVATISALAAALLVSGGATLLSAAHAEDTAPPDLATRVADLEAYVTNGAPKALVSSGPGHNAWMMTSAALVLFMTLPGLALFYGGLVRRKNVLSVLAQCCGMAGIVTILWWAFGYSMVFSKGSPVVGNMSFAFLKGVTSAPNSDYAYWVSQNVFSMYQLMFAIITPALIVGAIAERMKFSAIMLFLTLWMLVIYFPQAHMVWGIDGFMNGVWNADAKIKAIDFAGGTVRQAPRLRTTRVRSAQLGAHHGWHRHAVGGLVRLQRRQCRGFRWHRSQRVHDHHARGRSGWCDLACTRVAHEW
jgi:hypothetical protein